MKTIDCDDVRRRIARGKARLLTNLEDAGCPEVFKTAVRSELDWIRDDLVEEHGEEKSTR